MVFSETEDVSNATWLLQTSDTTKAPSTPATMSKQRSTLLPKTATLSKEFIVKFRPFDKVECCFDSVAGVDGA